MEPKGRQVRRRRANDRASAPPTSGRPGDSERRSEDGQVRVRVRFSGWEAGRPGQAPERRGGVLCALDWRGRSRREGARWEAPVLGPSSRRYARKGSCQPREQLAAVAAPDIGIHRIERERAAVTPGGHPPVEGVGVYHVAGIDRCRKAKASRKGGGSLKSIRVVRGAGRRAWNGDSGRDGG
ncbi:hypothetical protein C8R47DRAFT_1120811 [Mycena vitilis]|nr:hypothetical protein C8R47DRAFT_1120811 [Mycena vitilis]